MLKKALVASLVLVLVLTGQAFAKKGMDDGQWWHRPGVARTLDINEAEKAQLDQAYVESQRTRFDLKNAVSKARFELKQSLNADPLDEGRAIQAHRNLLDAQNALAEERFGFLVTVRKVLGAERFMRLEQMFKEFRQERRKARLQNWASGQASQGQAGTAGGKAE